jgi:5-formyltetrahydrofolate cyclo-ligase
MPEPNDSKALLRRRQRRLRLDIDAHERERFDRSIREHLRRLIADRGAGSVAAFWPFDGEPDLVPLLRQLADDGIELALPVVAPGRGGGMTFHDWRPGTAMLESGYGIPEPQGTPVRPARELDLIIMPLAAFDRRGNRLGMGAGYYDRYLATGRDSVTPLRTGVAYSLQEAEHIEPDPWDVPLHGVVTEKGWLEFGG